MSKRTRKPAGTERPSPPGTTSSRRYTPWPVVLVAMAASARADGGVGLQHLLQEAGFAAEPAMSIVVKRPRAARAAGGLVDPYVDDVLDALRALCVSGAA